MFLLLNISHNYYYSFVACVAHASSWMSEDGSASGTVYQYDEDKVYVDVLTASGDGVAGGPFCTGMRLSESIQPSDIIFPLWSSQTVKLLCFGHPDLRPAFA